MSSNYHDTICITAPEIFPVLLFCLFPSGSRSSALMQLLHTDTVPGFDSKYVDNPWKGAEAFHFLMLAQRQLYEGMKILSLT